MTQIYRLATLANARTKMLWFWRKWRKNGRRADLEMAKFYMREIKITKRLRDDKGVR